MGQRQSYESFGTDVIYDIQQGRTPGLDGFFTALTWIGYGVLYAALALAFFLWVNVRSGFKLLLVFAIISYVSMIAKLAAAQPRPFWVDPRIVSVNCEGGDFGVPSGHTSMAVTFMGFCMYEIYPYTRRGWWWFFCFLSLVWTLAVSFSRVYLGVHFLFVDVFVGFAVGLIVLAAMILPPWSGILGKFHLRQFTMLSLVCAVTLWALCLLCWMSARIQGVPEAWKTTAQTHCSSFEINPLSLSVDSAIIGAISGFLLAYAVERTYICFDADSEHWWRRLLRLLVLLPFAGLAYGGQKVINLYRNSAPAAAYISYFIGSFLLTFVLTTAGPWAMIRLRLASRERPRALPY